MLLTGAGSWGESAPSVLRKRDLLVAEGVKFDADGRVAIESIHVFGAAETGVSTLPAKSESKRAAKTVSSHKIDKRNKRAKS